ncbi:hypothetical protein OGAPHI_000996 [Ogataea philodendri]|uniref:Copper transport protein n=1 Tax=Ogataea philodendri TaxID=1378263 RepID=A0A9P8PEN4_9ASCO|nr:uncharacterized protein OGAPHI_000996 [Ogataea philodendri]KAH3670481.1 hypothetical protein OGAPHI_000996 [Ogataea philodendri]
MDHSLHSMDHMDHMDPMDPMDPKPMCKMSMLLNADYKNVCVLSSSWQITSFTSLIFTLIAICLISVGYELLKNWTLRWESRAYKQPAFTGNALTVYKAKSSLLYGLAAFYSLMIMLIFMTYNVWLMGAVVVGSVVGRYFFGFTETGTALPGSVGCH